MKTDMPFLPKLKERITSLAAGIKAALVDFFDMAADLPARIQVLADRLLNMPPRQKRRLALIAAAGLAVLLLIIVGISHAARGSSGRRRASSEGSGQTGGQSEAQRVIIPPDELFLPFEPDFVPGVMLEREPRSEWTAEDASPLWQDPLRNGEQEWRDMIEKTIDEIMESVP